MLQEPLRIGIVGIGAMGGRHLGLLMERSDCVVSAVCDEDLTALRRAKDQSGATPFTDANNMLASGMIDAVIIGVPPYLHADLAARALDHGLHIYCEKPFVTLFHEGYRLAHQARSAGLIIQVALQHRFQPTYAWAKKAIDEGMLGVIHRVNLTTNNWFRHRSYFETRPWRMSWEKAGGGVMLSQAIHEIDAVTWLLGSPQAVTSMAWRRRPWLEVEDDAFAIAEFHPGARAFIAASTIDVLGEQRFEIHGEFGSLIVERDCIQWARYPAPLGTLLDEASPKVGIPVDWQRITPRTISKDDLVRACHDDFISAVRGRSTNLVTAEEAARGIEFINAMYLSAVRGKKVRLPLSADEYGAVYQGLCSGSVSVPMRAISDAPVSVERERCCIESRLPSSSCEPAAVDIEHNAVHVGSSI